MAVTAKFVRDGQEVLMFEFGDKEWTGIVKPRVIHVRIDGITHQAMIYAWHDLLNLACESRFRKAEACVDVGFAAPVDCMSCLVHMVRC